MASYFSSPHQVAFVAIDCQRVFYGAAQGSLETERIAARINDIAPVLKQRQIALYGIYSNASRPDNAGLLPNIQKHGFVMPKSHESAVIGSNIAQRLKQAFRPQVIVGGFHLSTCVLHSALHLQQEGFTVAVASDLSGEGQRGRKLTEAQMRDKIAAAHRRLKNEGVAVAPMAQILPL